ncbi:MAG: S1 family peptidase [Myxococcota bacterium]|nr:S1 family peptidase [Myxococcota bacterium]
MTVARSPFRSPVAVGAIGVVWVAGCGGADPSQSTGESVVHSSSAIQGGTADTTHDFAVGVIESINQGVSFCSGVLLAPNLVATARHCVSQLTSPQIDCATSMFTSTLPTTNLLVIRGAGIHSNPPYAVAKVIVPAPAGVCGNDIALLILAQSISLPQYVTPTIHPPMTDHRAYTTSVTAIGYGVEAPTDTTGTSAGVRRIRQNINLSCIPNDKTFTDCFGFQNAQQYLSANEFEGGDGTCEGDSGSGAFDQGSFNNGKWVAFGVLSRGGADTEGGTCLGSVYTRFDSWAALLTDAARQAASMGGYPPPTWSGLRPDAGSASADASPAAGVAACLTSGTTCGADTDCCSTSCMSYGNAPYTCACDDAQNKCGPGYRCDRSLCVLPADAGHAATVHAGCAVSPLGSRSQFPWRGTVLTLVSAALARVRRRRRECRNSDNSGAPGNA